jgi:hypothetical protein
MAYDRFGNKARAKKEAERRQQTTGGGENGAGAVMLYGTQFMGAREAKKLRDLYNGIDECEEEALKLLTKTARIYYEAGNILLGVIKRFNWKAAGMTAKAVGEATGYPPRFITLSLKIFKAFEHNPDLLNGLSMRETLKLIAPPKPAGEEGYNRVDLGGDPGQMKLDFGKLFEVPATGSPGLQNYRTSADLLTEIIVVRRKGDLMTSKRFSHFCEDVPQDAELRLEYKNMVYKTQAAIEDYLAAKERKEGQL